MAARTDPAQTTITCYYSCRACHLFRVAVVVPARGAEDLETWMIALTTALTTNHRQRTPQCPATSLQDVMIPLQHTDRVGGPTLQ